MKLFTILLSLALSVSADALPCASDPFTDPKNDPCNYLGYIPSNIYTTIALGMSSLSYEKAYI